MTDREEAEREIARLRAAVNGLTEELVETKERLRQLEAHVDSELARIAETQPTSSTDAREDDTDTVLVADDDGEEPTVNEWVQKSDDHVEVVKHTRTVGDTGETAVPSVDPSETDVPDRTDHPEPTIHAEVVTRTSEHSIPSAADGTESIDGTEAAHETDDEAASDESDIIVA